jgi:hypothetical protein
VSTFLFNFKPQFARLVESGAKRQTIRATRADNRVPRPGDIAKCYTGLRTTKARLLLAAPVVRCEPVRIDFEARTVLVGATLLIGPRLGQFAKDDGFAGSAELFDWFKETHGPDDFEGFVVQWLPEFL